MTKIKNTMATFNLPIKKMHADAKIPVRATAGAAGYDLCALEEIVNWDSEAIAVRTGIAIAIPEGYYGRIAERSSMALHSGVQVGGGVIDSDYRGEIKVILMRSHANATLRIEKGTRIAQLIIEPCMHPALCEVAEFPEEMATARGESGFGSTGK